MAKKKVAAKATKKPDRRYWLFKSEPDVYSMEDLMAEPKERTHWDGVRNYQARNMLRDDIKKGDGVLFYYSRVKPMGIAGSCIVTKEGYPDHTAFDENEKHYDPKSKKEDPTWYMVDIEFVQKFPKYLTRDDLKEDDITAAMMVLKRGSRLSIQPVTKQEWQAVHKLAGTKDFIEEPPV